jgi:hypothetical protein
MTLTIDEAKSRIKSYIDKYYSDVRDDIFDWDSFDYHLRGYVADLSHRIAYRRGWQGHNWRQELRKLLISFAYNEIQKIVKNRTRKKRIKKVLTKVFTFGLAK